MGMEIKNSYNEYQTMNAAKPAGNAKQEITGTSQAMDGQEEAGDGVTLKISAQAKQAQEAAAMQKKQDVPFFSDMKEMMEYLKENYNVVSRGMASISGKYLRECLTDKDKLKKLLENLAAADEMDANGKENIKGYQGMKVKIDDNGDMETESYGGWVGFNEGKRTRQLAAAKTQANIQNVMAILQADLAECEAGKAKGMCDDETIGRIKAMIASAQQKMAEVSGNSEEANPADEQMFLMAGLM